MEILASFPPVITPASAVLILGSMPGTLSLRRRQYYAHPRNLFWPIMGDLVGVPVAAAYSERVAHLAQSGIALWDSLKYCQRRPGSLDADIVAGTEEPNDFATLLAEHRGIRAIAFNGKKSEQVFRQQALPAIPAALVEQLALIGLPSTSPANASLTYEQKLDRWRVILTYLPAGGGER
jgi:hypoxanthine-DNA glycosylase